MMMKDTYNAVLEDPLFKQTFTDRTIDMVAPGSGVDPEVIQKLRSLDLAIRIPEDIISSDMVYLANTDSKRSGFLEKALYSEDKNSVIWALRGGYGSARLIDHLSLLHEKPQHPRFFIGCSDLTALHLFLSQHWGWKTIHGSGLRGLLRPQQDPNNFLKIAALIAGAKQSSIEGLKSMNKEATALKQVKGSLTGGNLTLVQTSMGTPWQIQTHDKILFLEDVAEPGYKIDRALNQLRQAGVFKGVRGIVLGDFCEHDSVKADVLFALEQFAKETAIPVFKTDTFGHGNKNYPLVYNSEASIFPAARQGSFELQMQF